MAIIKYLTREDVKWDNKFMKCAAFSFIMLSAIPAKDAVKKIGRDDNVIIVTEEMLLDSDLLLAAQGNKDFTPEYLIPKPKKRLMIRAYLSGLKKKYNREELTIAMR